MADYSLQEMMAVMAAREVKNSDIILCGTGIAMLAAIAAKKITAPEASIFFETGAIDVQFAQTPLSLADPRIMHGAIRLAGLVESFNIIQNRTTGPNVISILGAAQIDIYGNLNSTSIGDYWEPKVRFSGSGGACDIGSVAGQFWVFMELGKKKFVEKVDYLTTPGFLDGAGAREKAGLIGGGPSLVITNKASFRFDDTTKKMYLHSYYPGFTPEAIQEEISFEVDLTRATEAKPPTEHEVNILRTQCDPDRMVLKS
ncbi:MAG: CoA-transferase [Syntrophobacteraceae bacterium]|jgi:glutaconate CoA-transferase subunit B